MPRLHCLRHADFEGLDVIATWAEEKGFEVRYSELYNGEALPKHDEVDLLVVMGGPMSVNDEQEYPWLVAEKQFIREQIERGTKVLGICLGAQLIAAALGARVYPGEQKEIGWFPISKVSESDSEFASLLPDTFLVFHWHGDTFDLPEGASHLARSEAFENQAFSIGSNVLALQCHPEVTPRGVEKFNERCGHQICDAPFIQTTEQFFEDPARFKAPNKLLFTLLDQLVV